MINSKYLDLDFYLKDSFSLAMQNSFGMKERVEMYYEFLEKINFLSNKLFYYVDFFYYNSSADNYFTRIHDMEPTYSADGSGTTNKFLTNLAEFFGYSRTMTLKKTIDTVVTYETLTLSDRDIVYLISALIARNNFDGTNGSLRKIYFGCDWLNEDLQNVPNINKVSFESMYERTFLSELKFVYYTSGTKTAQIKCQAPTLMYDRDNNKTNLYWLFVNGCLTIESCGIAYAYAVDGHTETGHYNTAIFNGLYSYGS